MKKRSFFDVQSPALEPVWLRAAIVTACGIWGLMELSRGAVFWALVFGAAAAFLFHQFFMVWNPHGEEDEEDQT